ncbi:MAG: carboxymuconolactone decarboxylase family protein [Actinomycetia bacterium]|nr:carboxymuconolactone decarboxylase family protein [Actinomycetes bacterium]MCP3910098.1 carboxymuconolactone decarboxylase family protein [Actinomycetes bacterium]MCP4084880.1 carboxymuconolactone decarboxylase family protein [Actinomycetes bacterium]
MADRPTQFRIQPVSEPDDETREALAKTIARDGEPLNIFGVLAHHPKLLKRFNLLGGFILNKGLLPVREREIVILRVGWNAQSRYEFGQHTVIGRHCGLSDDEIRRLTVPADEGQWSADDRALVDMCDDIQADDCVSAGTWARLAQRWNEAELIELVVTAGFYRMVSGFLNSTGVELDDGVPDFPGR